MSSGAAKRPGPPWVVKLGGSLAGGSLLGAWLEAIAGGGGRLVLVPGGGPFADQVREMQQRWGFDDRTAHRLALLAMEQYGLMLAGLQPGLVPADSQAAIRRVLGAAKVPVWLPTRMALGRPEIPESWDVTSDSLAAWLARQIGAAGLLLVKSVDVGEGSSAEDLAAAGIVDPQLPHFLARGVRACHAIAAARHREFAVALAQGFVAGTPVVTAAGEPG